MQVVMCMDHTVRLGAEIVLHKILPLTVRGTKFNIFMARMASI